MLVDRVCENDIWVKVVHDIPVNSFSSKGHLILPLPFHYEVLRLVTLVLKKKIENTRNFYNV